MHGENFRHTPVNIPIKEEQILKNKTLKKIIVFNKLNCFKQNIYNTFYQKWFTMITNKKSTNTMNY